MPSWRLSWGRLDGEDQRRIGFPRGWRAGPEPLGNFGRAKTFKPAARQASPHRRGAQEMGGVRMSWDVSGFFRRAIRIVTLRDDDEEYRFFPKDTPISGIVRRPRDAPPSPRISRLTGKPEAFRTSVCLFRSTLHSLPARSSANIEMRGARGVSLASQVAVVYFANGGLV